MCIGNEDCLDHLSCEVMNQRNAVIVERSKRCNVKMTLVKTRLFSLYVPLPQFLNFSSDSDTLANCPPLTCLASHLY